MGAVATLAFAVCGAVLAARGRRRQRQLGANGGEDEPTPASTEYAAVRDLASAPKGSSAVVDV